MKKTASYSVLSRGFTVVELLVVIVVIGILSTIGVVTYSGIQDRSREASVASELKHASSSLALYYTQNQKFPPDLATAGVQNAKEVSFEYSLGTDNFCVTGTNKNVSLKIDAEDTPVKGGCPGHAVGGVQPTTNLFTNPSFETAITPLGWSNRGGSITRSTEQKHSGNSSAKMVIPGVANDAYAETYVGLTAGTYTFSAYIYLTSANPSINNNNTWFHVGSGGTITSPTGEPRYDMTKLNQWQRIQRTVTLTTNGSANMRLRFYGPSDSVMYIDSIMITKTNSALNYADGNSPNWVWNGTRNNSTSKGMPL